MRRPPAGFSVLRECELSYTAQKRPPTFAASPGGYILLMNDGIYFADPELPFHVWVREPSGAGGYRWVLRDARPLTIDPLAASREAGNARGATQGAAD